nr:CGNR zinc finger domain-containing protein [Rhodococcus sp. JVH1]
MDEHSGGAPLLGEPIAIELANTAYASRGRPREGLQKPEHLATWLRDVRIEVDEVTDGDLTATLRLRDAIRAIASAIVKRSPLDADAVSALNEFAGGVPQWRELRIEPELHSEPCTSGRSLDHALSVIASSAVDLFGGTLRCKLRACEGPGCVLFFIKDHPRREWCSHGCGNRARAARHYARIRQSNQSS